MANGSPPGEFRDILIRDGKIADILPPGSKVDEAEVISAKAMIVMPGLVDTHRHTWQTQLRTVAADWTLFDYIVKMRSIYSAFYTPEDAYLGNLLGALESINAGITTIVDHCHLINSPEHADALIGGLADSGIRGVFCYGFFVNPGHNPYRRASGPGWRYDDVRRVRKERLASDTGRILFGISPQEPEGIPSDVLLEEIALARELGAKTISMHVAMGNYDGGNRVVAGLQRTGNLGQDMLFVHGAALGEDELDAIAASGAGLSCTPETELQMGMGFPVAFAAREHGVRTSLGIDIVSNYAADMFMQMRLALQSARAMDNHALAAQGKAPRNLRYKAGDVLKIATLGGAEALHQERSIGSLERGKAADLILVRDDGLNMTPSPDPVAALVFGATPADVDTVIIDGVVRKRSGRIEDFDVTTLKQRLCESAVRIAEGARTVDHAQIEGFWAQIFPNLA
jgi:cytosine/adenosine deaminase-related metal-dependent hydrolase